MFKHISTPRRRSQSLSRRRRRQGPEAADGRGGCLRGQGDQPIDVRVRAISRPMTRFLYARATAPKPTANPKAPLPAKADKRAIR